MENYIESEGKHLVKNMADVEIMQTVSETKKTKKVKKTTKRRESEVQITEVEHTDQNEEKGYVSSSFVAKCISVGETRD